MYRIGIPRALLYWIYYPLWINFFEQMGCEVVVSPLTTKRLSIAGIKLAVDDLCLPVKVAFGHVLFLRDVNVDFIFLPYVISVEREGFMCPKFAGFPDMVRVTIDNLPKILSPCFDVKRGYSIDKQLLSVSNELGIPKSKAKKALYTAKKLAEKESCTTPPNISQPAIALIAHPYNLYDSYINHNIHQKLANLGFSVVTPQMLPYSLTCHTLSILPKALYWTLGKELVAAALYLAKERLVHGLIYLVTFACALDSILQEIISIKLKEIGLPYMQLVVDEHTSDCAFLTRIEAFCELLRRRCE